MPLDMVGEKYGRLTVVALAYRTDKASAWVCKCECGETRTVFRGNLLSGGTKSCGCLSRETLITNVTTHGLSKTPEFATWMHMKDRCKNPNHPQYHYYGGRGITVCQRWLDGFENFLADMGHKPSPSHSIDRVDCSKGYGPDNCRWATPSEQGRNRRNNVIITVGDKSACISEWAEITGISRQTINNRLKNGWSHSECTSPARRKRKP